MTRVTRGRVVALNPHVPVPKQQETQSPAQTGGRVVDEMIVDAAVRARQIIDEAQAEAARRLRQLEADIEEIRGDLREQARTVAETELLGKSVRLATLQRRALEAAKRDIIVVAQALAERILHEEIALDPQRAVHLAEQVLRETRGARAITLRAAPDNAALLKLELDKLLIDTSFGVSVLPDETLGPGDLMVETEVGNVDARIGTQLAHLAATITESVR